MRRIKLKERFQVCKKQKLLQRQNINVGEIRKNRGSHSSYKNKWLLKSVRPLELVTWLAIPRCYVTPREENKMAKVGT